MNRKYEELVADYLKGNLSRDQRQEVEKLLERGEIDLIEFRAMEELYADLKQIQSPEPGAGMSQRFYAMLEKEKQAQKKDLSQLIKEKLFRLVEQFTLPKLAYAVVLLMAGGWAGSSLSENSQEVYQLQSQVQDMRQMMMITMLEGPSATDRIKAVNISSELNTADEKAIRALLFTLNNDPSVNVRVHAIEALKRWSEDERVRKGLITAISRQQSPVVIVELADTMIELELKNSAGELEKLLQERQLDFNVKQKLENSIAELI